MKFFLRRLPAFCVFCFLVISGSLTNATEAGAPAAKETLQIYVSPAVDNDGDGSKDKPLGTLESARDALRTMANRGPAIVILQAGRYFRNQTFELDQRDCNTVYRAQTGAKVVLDGGRLIPDSNCEKVTDSSVLSRLVDPEAAQRLYQIDLRRLGITEFGEFGPRGFQRQSMPAPVEVSIDETPLRIARWPNLGEKDIPLGEVIDAGSARRYNNDEPLRPGSFKYTEPRVERWTKASDLFLHGFFSNGFADDSIPVAEIDTQAAIVKLSSAHYYGIGLGSPASVWGWFAENLLEEIDQPGEYYLDRSTGIVYFHGPERFAPGSGQHQIQVSLMTDSFVSGKGVKDLTFDGIVFENSRGSGGQFSGERISLIDCQFRNLGGSGVSLDGDSNALEGCRFIDLGAGGVSISGGDRRTLHPGNNVVRHCEIASVNRWYKTYKPCISLSGVGNFIQHNYLHDCPGQGIIMSGNDHVIEFNELARLVNWMSDQGAIYMGRNPSCAGNVIRFNFIHDTVSQHDGYGNSGIFLDDGASGQFVMGNVFYNTGKNGAIKYHGGQFNKFINNVVIDCTNPIKYLLWDQQRWEMFLAGKQQVDNLLRQVNVLAPPYSTRYPQLAEIYTTPYSREPDGEARTWITTADDPLFANGAQLDFRIVDYEALREQVPNFAEIPWEEIGPIPQEQRNQLPPARQAAKLAEQQLLKRDDLNKAYDDAKRPRPLWLKQ